MLVRRRDLAELRHAPSLALIPLLITTIRVTARAQTEIDLWGGCSEVRCDRVDGRMLVGADGLSAFPVSVGDLVGDVEDEALVVVELLGCGLALALGASEPPRWRCLREQRAKVNAPGSGESRFAGIFIAGPGSVEVT